MQLWLAIYFKERKKCRINPPEYLDQEYIENLIKSEKINPEQLMPIPHDFFEIANIFLKQCYFKS